ncbi:hypothetical protein LCGC14_1320260 [marine sediment metagenome]|uniref:Uncharacterized protein n=1 Tax=marine sediment metagenome TaxID=412755 RepID=A0A0F9N0I5_9ZZZZ
METTEYRQIRKAKLDEELNSVLASLNEMIGVLGAITQRVVQIQMELGALDEAEA